MMYLGVALLVVCMIFILSLIKLENCKNELDITLAAVVVPILFCIGIAMILFGGG